jgi:hypothetical protein
MRGSGTGSAAAAGAAVPSRSGRSSPAPAVGLAGAAAAAAAGAAASLSGRASPAPAAAADSRGGLSSASAANTAGSLSSAGQQMSSGMRAAAAAVVQQRPASPDVNLALVSAADWGAVGSSGYSPPCEAALAVHKPSDKQIKEECELAGAAGWVVLCRTGGCMSVCVIDSSTQCSSNSWITVL